MMITIFVVVDGVSRVLRVRHTATVDAVFVGLLHTLGARNKDALRQCLLVYGGRVLGPGERGIGTCGIDHNATLTLVRLVLGGLSPNEAATLPAPATPATAAAPSAMPSGSPPGGVLPPAAAVAEDAAMESPTNAAAAPSSPVCPNAPQRPRRHARTSGAPIPLSLPASLRTTFHGPYEPVPFLLGDGLAE